MKHLIKPFSLPVAILIITLLLSIMAWITCSSRQSLPVVELTTGFGAIHLEIDTLNAPVTGKNFLRLVNLELFQHAVFYRVVRMDNQPGNPVKIEVVQGGLYHDSLLTQVPVIVHEDTRQTGILHRHGTLSMARLGPGTASSEFFICIGKQPSLDFGGERNPDGHGFAAFGKVTKGMKVVKKIHRLANENQYLIEPVAIRQIKIK
jgi:peptidyl-prolyl cis-trans isomerase A (cyclophilin A)